MRKHVYKLKELQESFAKDAIEFARDQQQLKKEAKRFPQSDTSAYTDSVNIPKALSVMCKEIIALKNAK